MSSLHETAYPRLKAAVSDQELAEIYTPTVKERSFARQHGRTPAARGALLILLKTVQRLGYFVSLKAVPKSITSHILACDDLSHLALSRLREYDRSGGVRQRMLDAIRQQVGIKAFTVEGKAVVRDLAREAATTKQDLADIINVVIEELVRQRFELPGFSTLQRTARQARSQVNTGFFRTLNAALTEQQKQEFDRLLHVPDDSPHTSWHKLKQEPKKPTNTEVKKYLQHLEWLQGWCQRLPAVDHIPAAKYHHFILEARALDAANIKAMQSTKRYALMILLVHAQLRRAMDDAVDIFVRKMRNIKTKAEARSRLSATAERIDRDFPENEHAVFNGEELVIRKHRRTAPPDGLAEIDKQLSLNLPEKNILDILVEAEKWLGLHKRFGPLSGYESKLEDPRTHARTAWLSPCASWGASSARCSFWIGCKAWSCAAASMRG